ncbi:MAG: serine/threonine protein kinase [Holophagaceae bacterium]|nr:serine/threonine protein kinase [Holophagaceae bacterium]
MDGPQNSLPSAIGRYEIKRLLGSGAMGSVYLAEDPRIKRKVAVKVVKMDAMRSDADRQEFMLRFQREAEISGLLNHPGIVAIYDVGESALGPFLAMEFVPGQPLDDLIKSGAPFPIKDKLRIAAGVAEALDHAHAAGIVHRDVKPGNVMITEDGRPKLMDFGIAKREDANLTQTGTFLGTPSYASPEQIREGTVDGRSDQFSFAVLVFEMLSGVSPFPGNSINTILYRIVNEPPIEVQPPVLGILPGGWQRIFFRALAKKPADRYASCGAFVKDLMDATTEIEKDERRELLGILRMGGDVPMPPIVSRASDETMMEPSSPSIMVAPRKNNGGLVAAGILLLGLAGAGGWYVLKGGTRVMVKSDPPKAAVFINDKKAEGETPVSVPLKAGDKVRIEHKGFEAAEFTFAAGDKPEPKLKPIVREMTLNSDPAGASVTMDEKLLPGTTPVRVTWNEGVTHHLTLQKGDSLGFNHDYAVGEKPGDTPLVLRHPDDVSPLDPTAAATLKLSGGFSVRLRVDGKDMGELTSSRPVALAPGVHKLDLSNAAVFYRDSRSITASPGQSIPIVVPGTAKITVETHPGSDKVSVDGTPTPVESDGSGSITVSRGRHVISVRGTKQPVDVNGDQKVSFKI